MELQETTSSKRFKSSSHKLLVAVCGFGGSGKTFLVRSLARKFSDRDLSIVINDGKISIDPHLNLLKQETSELLLRLPIIAQTAGCVCCDEGSSIQAILDHQAVGDVVILELNSSTNCSKLESLRFRASEVVVIAMVNVALLCDSISFRKKHLGSMEAAAVLMVNMIENSDVVWLTGVEQDVDGHVSFAVDLCRALHPASRVSRLPLGELGFDVFNRSPMQTGENPAVRRFTFESSAPFHPQRFVERFLNNLPTTEGDTAYRRLINSGKMSESSWGSVVRVRSADLWLASQPRLNFDLSYVGCLVKLVEGAERSADGGLGNSRCQSLVIVHCGGDGAEANYRDDLARCVLSASELETYHERLQRASDEKGDGVFEDPSGR
jgi:G3E family GTPase